MPDQTNAQNGPSACPICGNAAQAGYLTSDVLQWLQCEPDSWQGILTLGGRVGTFTKAGQTMLAGIRCNTCRRFVLEDSTPSA